MNLAAKASLSSNRSWRDFKREVADGKLPCALRAIDQKTNIHHFVEWHGGQWQELRKMKSHAQVSIYKDLCQVRTESSDKSGKQSVERSDEHPVPMRMWPSAVAVSRGLSWTSDGKSVASVMMESALDSGTIKGALSPLTVKNVSFGQS